MCIRIDISEPLRSAKTATKRESRYIPVFATLRMANSQGAVLAVAIPNFYLGVRRWAVLSVTSVAKVCCAKAVPKSNWAAEHALPVNLFCAMLVTATLASTKQFHHALFATQVLLFCLLLITKLDLAVYHASKVGFFALKTLVEWAGMDSETQQIILIEVSLALKSFVLIKSLHSGSF